jgi:hypothetical protein
MKTPMRYQATEYDCAPTTLVNAISYLFSREEIPPDIIKHIMLYCLDAYNIKGEFGKNGTSAMAMMFISNWLNQFGKVKRFPIHCDYLTGDNVFIGSNGRIASCLHQGGAVVVRLRYGTWHYVLLTGIDGMYVSLFDPYFRKKPFKQAGIEIVSDEPEKRNRKVAWQWLNNTQSCPYSLGVESTREAVLLFNERTRRRQMESIEYFI